MIAFGFAGGVFEDLQRLMPVILHHVAITHRVTMLGKTLQAKELRRPAARVQSTAFDRPRVDCQIFTAHPAKHFGRLACHLMQLGGS